MSQINDLRNETPESLVKKVAETQAELSLLKAKVRLGQEKNSAKVSVLRKMIARMLTILGQH